MELNIKPEATKSSTPKELAEIPKLLDELDRVNNDVIDRFQVLREKIAPVTNFYPRPEADSVNEAPETTTEIGTRLQATVERMYSLQGDIYDTIERVEL